MKRSVKLSISKPCSEKFSNFYPTEIGGYCDSCKKEVIDFTQMSERDILKHLDNELGKTCGYFRNVQIKTYSTPVTSDFKQKVNYLGTRIASFILLSFLSISKSQAQEIEQSPTMQVHLDKNSLQDHDSILINGEYEVTGILVDKNTNEPLPFANVMLKDSGTTTMTDMDGRFKFPHPLKTGDKLVFAYVGYRPVQVEITTNALSTLYIKIELDDTEMTIMGEVMVDQVYASKSSIWQKLKMKFK
jgi:hypothetical protein